MKYQGKEIELISKRTIFGKSIAEIRILATNQIIDVPLGELVEDGQSVSCHEIAFKVYRSQDPERGLCAKDCCRRWKAMSSRFRIRFCPGKSDVGTVSALPHRR